MQDSEFCWHRCADKNYISAGLQQGIVRRGFLRRRRSKWVVLCFLLFLYFDPEYESLSQRIHPPMVCIDNDTYDDCSLVMVDSANRHEILLEVVQVLTDLDLVISKADISSDGGWFMDVFHVTDHLGNKLMDQRIIDYIQQALGEKRGASTMEVRTCMGRTVGEHTAIEMTGTNRPGLLSEISKVLTNLKCNVVAADVRTHNMRVACVVHIIDNLTSRPIEDPDRPATIKEQLSNVLKGNDDRKGVETDFPMGLTHIECRLHQMMFADRDYEGPETSSLGEDGKPIITIDSCIEKGYSVVTIRSKDRPKLLFDTVCTLTDMQYVVFHASVNSSGSCALQEYYIRHMDGCTLDTEGEKQRVIKCLDAAIERRVSDSEHAK